MGELKAIHNSDLIKLVVEADHYEFNRRLVPEFIEELDPNGVSVMQFLLRHTASWTTGKEEPRWPAHFRVFVFAKMAGKEAPERVLLDVREEQWDLLTDASDMVASS